MPKNDQKNLQLMVWLAIALSSLSLLASFIALSQTKNLESTLNSFSTNKMEQIGVTTEQSLARAEAQLKLMALQTKLQSEEAVENTEQDVEEIRTSLEGAYDAGTQEGKEQIDNLEKDLDQLEVELREGSAAALGSIQRLLNTIQTEVQPS